MIRPPHAGADVIARRPPRRLSRRTLLGAIAAVCAGAVLGARRRLYGPEGPPWTPALDGTAPGPIGERTLATLVAAAKTAVGRPVEASHYGEYFRWRAEHLPGYRTLYDRFGAQLDHDARRAVRCPFAECNPADRTRMLRAADRARAPRTIADRAWLLTGGRAWVAYDTFILGEALALFADTDAWVLLGYDGWPGRPRGLDRYRRAPS